MNAAIASGGITISEIGSTPSSAGLSSGLDYQMISVGGAAKFSYHCVAGRAAQDNATPNKAS